LQGRLTVSYKKCAFTQMENDCHGYLPEYQHTFAARVANGKGACAKRNALAVSFSRVLFSS